MSDPDLTVAQRRVLGQLHERFPPERIDRLWIFDAHQGKLRETGLFVASLLTGEQEPAEQRILVTIRYDTETVKGGVQVNESVEEEGRAPRDRIERVIEGVLRRTGDEPGESFVEAIEGDAERWSALLTRLGLWVDPVNQE